MTNLFERHREKLERALQAIRERTYWSAYSEAPSGRIYGETAKDDGLAAFKGRLGHEFALDQPGAIGRAGEESSPFGIDLNTTYPRADLDVLLPAARHAIRSWSGTTAEQRAGICMEMLHRLNHRSFELAFAVMHTTGQGFLMAFQAGGPHAQDRGLEAVAYAYEAMRRVPAHATWSKQVSKTETVTLEKRFRLVPRGVAVAIGCSTFPTWNSYPGIFASLATGNAVVVKPHSGAVLPLAITVEVMRDVLREEGFDPNLVTLAVDTKSQPIAKELVTRPEVRIIDYTGSTEFGEWVEQHAKQAEVFSEKAGVNCAIIDSTDNLKAMTGNLAFTLSLYSGQMCTTTQNIFIPRDGISVNGECISFDDAAAAIVKAIDWLLGEPARGAEILGAVQNEATARRIDQAKGDGGTVLRESMPVVNEMFPKARVHSPLIMKIDASDDKLFMREMFGPIAYIIATESTEHSIELAVKCAEELGSITAAIYSVNDKALAEAEEALLTAGVPLSCNLAGQIYVNQSAAFSDYHVSGANPSGNATLCDENFVTRRFNVVYSRTPIESPAKPQGVEMKPQTAKIGA